MDKNAGALKRSAEHFKCIMRGVREDLLREKVTAEEAFVKSLEWERQGGGNHDGDGDPPDRAAESLSIKKGHRIQQVEAALGRIDRGTFGQCFKKDECPGTGMIEHFLLVNDPTRLFCQECQGEEDERIAREERMAKCRPTIVRKRG